ncbi:MAG: HupE/UreJ family protein [Polyangiaceae bacterium]|nr:HupE/UreJ family protein [Polyangiaceae bacterium]
MSSRSVSAVLSHSVGWCVAFAVACCLLLSPTRADAHALAPIVVRTLESRAQGMLLSVRFPTPEQAAGGLEISGCDTAPLEQALSSGTLWSGALECDAGTPHYVRFPAGTPTGVLWEDARGAQPEVQLFGEQPPGFRFLVPARATGPALAGYFTQGIGHVWSGWDHLLFVACLVLLSGPWWLATSVRRLFAVVTLFTVAHSLSLALSVAVGGLGSPGVEAAIALSVAFAAREVVLRLGAQELEPDRVATRRLYWTAALFGLLHGLGFASALLELGLPKGQVPAALLLFNLGVELGQVSVVSALLVCLCIVPRRGVRPLALTLSYAAGALALFWMVQRVRGV